MTDLLPCPFCGSRNVDPEGWMSSKPDGSETGIISTGPACDECAGSTESVERWNQRVPLSIGGAQTESGCDIDSVSGTADDQGLFAQRGPEPVAWRWRNELGPEDCWTYSPRKPDAHPQYITEPLYTSSALTRSTASTVDAQSVGASDETKPIVETAREMLRAGINIQAIGDATNAVITGLLQKLLAHIDDLGADLRCSIALGRAYADRSDHGVVRPIIDSVSRSGSHGGAGCHQSLEERIERYIADLRRTPSGGSADDIANELERMLNQGGALLSTDRVRP